MCFADIYYAYEFTMHMYRKKSYTLYQKLVSNESVDFILY